MGRLFAVSSGRLFAVVAKAGPCKERPARAGRGALHAPLGGFNPPLRIIVHQPVLMGILHAHTGRPNTYGPCKKHRLRIRPGRASIYSESVRIATFCEPTELTDILGLWVRLNVSMYRRKASRIRSERVRCSTLATKSICSSNPGGRATSTFFGMQGPLVFG